MQYLISVRIIDIIEKRDFSFFVLGSSYETNVEFSQNLQLFCNDDPDLIDCRTSGKIE